MKILIKLILISLVVLSILISGCDETSDDPLNPGRDLAGNDNGTYVSDAALDNSIILPDDVLVTGLDSDFAWGYISSGKKEDYLECAAGCTIGGVDMVCVMTCVNDAVSAHVDVGIGAFYVAIKIFNDSATTKTVTINAGTILNPYSSHSEPLMLIQDIDLSVGRGEHDFLLPVYSLAPSVIPLATSNTYIISAITTNSCLRDILEIVENVNNINFDDAKIIQNTIWNCSPYNVGELEDYISER